MQTNGTLLTDEWCEFFREHNFLIGLSLDGPPAMHDAYRKDKGGHPTADKVMRAARLLKEHRVDFNILTTVNAANADHPLDVYRFLRDDIGAASSSSSRLSNGSMRMAAPASRQAPLSPIAR